MHLKKTFAGLLALFVLSTSGCNWFADEKAEKETAFQAVSDSFASLPEIKSGRIEAESTLSITLEKGDKKVEIPIKLKAETLSQGPSFYSTYTLSYQTTPEISEIYEEILKDTYKEAKTIVTKYMQNDDEEIPLSYEEFSEKINEYIFKSFEIKANIVLHENALYVGLEDYTISPNEDAILDLIRTEFRVDLPAAKGKWFAYKDQSTLEQLFEPISKAKQNSLPELIEELSGDASEEEKETLKKLIDIVTAPETYLTYKSTESNPQGTRYNFSIDIDKIYQKSKETYKIFLVEVEDLSEKEADSMIEDIFNSRGTPSIKEAFEMFRPIIKSSDFSLTVSPEGYPVQTDLQTTLSAEKGLIHFYKSLTQFTIEQLGEDEINIGELYKDLKIRNAKFIYTEKITEINETQEIKAPSSYQDITTLANFFF